MKGTVTVRDITVITYGW